MHEIIEAFGIDWRLIVIQIFNFGILVGVLWYFLYTPVLKLLSERETKIRKGVEDAEKAEDALARAEEEKHEVLKEAHTEASAIVARGTLHAEEKAKTLLDETADRISRDIMNAKELAEHLKTAAIKESEAEIAKLAILGAEKVIGEKLSK